MDTLKTTIIRLTSEKDFEHMLTVIFIIKIVAITFSGFLIAYSIILIKRGRALRTKIQVNYAMKVANSQIAATPLEEYKIKIYAEKFDKIFEKAKTGSYENITLAIIDADSLVDEALKERGIHGKTMAERLKSLQNHNIKTLNELWEAHKLRNKIAHDAHYEIKTEEAQNALKSYKAVLQELGIINE